jgi:hypothetical protein
MTDERIENTSHDWRQRFGTAPSVGHELLGHARESGYVDEKTGGRQDTIEPSIAQVVSDEGRDEVPHSGHSSTKHGGGDPISRIAAFQARQTGRSLLE